MSELSNKASYLQGLADGMKLDTEKNEGKLLSEVISLLCEITNKIELIEDEQDFFANKFDEIEDVIEVIGEELYADGCDCDCEDDEEFTITCANCGEEFNVTDEDIMDGSMNCPFCGQDIEFDFDCDCDCDCEDGECDCGCDCE